MTKEERAYYNELRKKYCYNPVPNHNKPFYKHKNAAPYHRRKQSST